MILTKEQIHWVVRALGQPKASIVLRKFFYSYRISMNSEDVAEVYDSTYLDIISKQETYLTVNRKYKINLYHRYAYDYLVHNLNPDTTVLDIGCGAGDFCLALRFVGVNGVVGIDYTKKAIAEANAKKIDGCNFMAIDAVEYSKSCNQKFDFITLNDVTEHLSDNELLAVLKNVTPLLKPQGAILIHTPNGLSLCQETDENFVSWLYRKYLELFCGWDGFKRSEQQIYYDQTHINVKSYRQLKMLLDSLGLKSQVIYDAKSKIPFKTMLSPNMLVVVKPMQHQLI